MKPLARAIETALEWLLICLMVALTVIVVVAWVIIGLLLLGRYLWGWRGRKAIYCTFSGVLLLLIVYFGSKLMFLH